MNDLPINTGKTATLLLVDDEINVLKALKRLFRGDEYQVHLAENGAAGLEILQRQPIDLVISDMRMPQMDGAEFLTRVADRWPDTVRILLTGYADLESTIAAVNKGRIYSYCSKPWEDNELKILVNNALEQKRLREERQQLFEIIHRQNQELKDLNACLEDKVEKRTEQLKKSLQRLDQANEALKKQFTDSIKAFARIIEMRPGIKSGHAKYIAEHAREVASRMNMDTADIKDVVYAGLLLQIGKMSLPDNLLTLPLFKMNSQQKSQFLSHAQEGRNLLKDVERLHTAALLISRQFEHYDGSGFPAGLLGKDIPLGARILAVIRDYITYLDGSITGTAMTSGQVKGHLLSRKRKEYDPDAVDAFLALLAESESTDERPVIEISWTQLQPGMEAAEILCNDVLYLKDQVLTVKNVEDIFNLRKHAKSLILRIRLGSEQENNKDH
ncbi:MAG: HD domain-containing phosphohydrolase [Methylomonas sp.]